MFFYFSSSKISYPEESFPQIKNILNIFLHRNEIVKATPRVSAKVLQGYVYVMYEVFDLVSLLHFYWLVKNRGSGTVVGLCAIQRVVGLNPSSFQICLLLDRANHTNITDMVNNWKTNLIKSHSAIYH